MHFLVLILINQYKFIESKGKYIDSYKQWNIHRAYNSP